MKMNRKTFQYAASSLLAVPFALQAAKLTQNQSGFGKAKRVIYLHMAGSPSQLDLFDEKPVLKKFNGQPCPKEIMEAQRFAFIKGQPKLLGSPFEFKRHGQSGTPISELLPEFSKLADDVSIVRSMHTDAFNHAPAQLLIHTGTMNFGAASMGSWINYAMGSENPNLPGYVVLNSGGKNPSAGKSVWGSGYLPSQHQGVQCRNTGDPILYTSNPAGIDRQLRRFTLDAITSLNRKAYKRHLDFENPTRNEQYELAFRMQETVPEAMNLSREPRHILELYGADTSKSIIKMGNLDPRDMLDKKKVDTTFANNCLMARRLIERGVRFVQLYDWGWDHHAANPNETIDGTLPIKAAQIDRAMSGLLIDLKQRGLLEDTLVVWGGEFGRTPMQQKGGGGKNLGRDHLASAFTMWFAGGGIKGGFHLGATDDLGVAAVDNPVHVRDMQATVLHLLGINPYHLSYPFQGLDARLIGPTNEARIIKEMIT